MSDNVGLSTPRGSGTSGYVQRNLAHIRPRDYGAPYPKDLDSLRHKQRQPDKEILEHDRKRDVEVKVFELRDRLEDEGYVASSYLDMLHVISDRQADICNSVDEEEIDKQCDELRAKLLEDMAKGKGDSQKRSYKSHQVHEMAEAKIKQTERLRSALKISKDYEEGGHWKRQEERLRTALEKDTAESKDEL
jgi:hypothetical protein